MALRSKRIKTGLLLGGVVGLLVIGATGALMRPALEPDKVVAARFGDVVWNHELHARMKGIANCQVCHHTERQGTADPKPCRTCHKPQSNRDALLIANLHTDEATPQYQDQDGPPPMTAFHAKCVGCHKAMSEGPVGCRDCHTQTFTSSQGKVSWDHGVHARQIDMGAGDEPGANCVYCHHQDSGAATEADYRACDRCHRPAAVLGLDMKTGTEQHEELRHGECARCHVGLNPEDDARSCKDCHTSMEFTAPQRPAIEQAVHKRCMECHNANYSGLTDSMPFRCSDCHQPDPSLIADLGVGLIMWDHDRHANYGDDMSCDKCHHTDEPNQPHMACSKCHGTGLYENPTVSEALRERCLGCHEERKNGLISFAQVATDREQLSRFEYRGADGSFWWNHRDHAVAWSFSCRNCHHGLLQKDGAFVMAKKSKTAWEGDALRVQTCRNCHGSDGPVAGSPAAGSEAPKFDDAFKRVCLECHQKLGAGPREWKEFFAIEPLDPTSAPPTEATP
jgi:hypothetical protein